MVTALPSSTLGWRYDTSAGDTNWIAYTSAISATTSDTGVALATNTVYILQMRIPTTSRAEFVTRNLTTSGAPVTTALTGFMPTGVTTLNLTARSRALVAGAEIGIGQLTVQEGRRVI